MEFVGLLATGWLLVLGGLVGPVLGLHWSLAMAFIGSGLLAVAASGYCFLGLWSGGHLPSTEGP